MKTCRHLLIALSLLSVLPACSRVYSVSRYGVQAALVDTSSGQAITTHPVHVKVDRSDFALTTTRRGRISTPSAKFGYWTWLGGPMWGSNEKARIEISSPGYQPRTFIWDRYNSPGPFNEHRGTIDLGEVKLQPR